MNKLLSQDEVDSLLTGLDTGDLDVDNDLENLDLNLESFDWTANSLNVRGNMPLLEVVNNRFSQKFRNVLSSSLRKIIDVSPNPLTTIKYSDFQRSLPVPTSMHLFKMEPLRGIGILVIESKLVFSLVEAFFGGSGSGATKIEGREFTTIENKIIDKVVQLALINFIEAWEDVYPIKTEFIRSESNPLVVNVVPGEELLISTKFEVELNKPMGTIMICVPYSSYQPIRSKLAGGYKDNEETVMDIAWISKLKSRLQRTDVSLVVDLGNTTLSVKDFLNLRQGDIIVLENDAGNALKAKAEGVPLFEGFAGRSKNKKVFKVEKPILTRE